MAIHKYYERIVDALRGQAEELRDTTDDRLDWGGSSLVLELYDEASGSERDEIISAMKQIIEEGKEDPSVVAQVIHIASSLDIAQVQPSVKKLQDMSPLASDDVVRTAINNYLAFRNLRHNMRAGVGS